MHSCPNESKRLDQVYLCLVRGEYSEIKDRIINPVIFFKEIVVTGHMNDLLGPPSIGWYGLGGGGGASGGLTKANGLAISGTASSCGDAKA